MQGDGDSRRFPLERRGNDATRHLYAVEPPRGPIYIGVTSNLGNRLWEHREGYKEGFTSRYKLERLVYVEYYSNMRDAIAREKALKKWKREWKVELIEEENPKWKDLSSMLL